MDAIQDWAGHLLGQDVTSYAPYVYQLYNFAMIAKLWTLDLVEQVSHKPDLATLALLLIIVLVSLKILNMLWQTLLFWLRLLRTVLFWGGLGALALWMWSRGPNGMMSDVEHWSEVWSHEYGYWKEREQSARLLQQGKDFAVQQGWLR